MVTHGYDWSSGLAFAETVVGVTSKQSRDNLATRCLGRKPEYVPLPKGAQTLGSIVMRKLLCNLSSLDEPLTTVPTAILEQIWTAICRSQLDSIKVWRLFAVSRIGNKSLIKSNTVSFKAGRMESLVTAVRSPSLTWLTNLVVYVDGLEPTTLMQIANINTLRRLHIVQITSPRRAPPVFEDRMFRSWAESAKSTGALSKLSMLFVYQCPGFTSLSLGPLRSFPALEELCIYRCGIVAPDRSRERELGWRQSKR